MEDARGGFEHIDLGAGVTLNLHRADRFKTTRLDVFLQERLAPRVSTRVALVCRLLERGTTRLPDLRHLNRFTDDLYGASYAVDLDQMGDRQIVHLWFECLDERFLPPGQGDLLQRGAGFLHDLLCHPVEEAGGFRPDYLRQEKSALRLSIESVYNDKSLYAQRRCVEEMCADESCGVHLLGDVADFRGINGRNLLAFHRSLLSRSPVDVYVSGGATVAGADTWRRWIDFERRFVALEPSAAARAVPPAPVRRVTETASVSQDRLVMGYRSLRRRNDPGFAALVVLNALWGGDGQSRLFRALRERRSLCYQVGSHLDGLCGLLFVSAATAPGSGESAAETVRSELAALARGDLPQAELSAARSLLLGRLELLDDDRAALARHDLRLRIGGASGDRHALRAALAGVTATEVCEAAGMLRLDTVYLLHGPVRGSASGGASAAAAGCAHGLATGRRSP